MNVFYTDRFVPDNSAACARGPFIFIRPKYKDDAGLLEHEKTHVRQWLRTFGLHSFLYLMSKAYRLKAEVEAYKVQLKYCDESNVDLFAGYIADYYGLSTTKEQAKELLKNTSE